MEETYVILFSVKNLKGSTALQSAWDELQQFKK